MKPCMFFNSPRGCRNGENCTFLHDISSQQRVTNNPEESPQGQVQVKRRTRVTITFVNGVEETFNAISIPAQTIRSLILTRETEQMFGEAGEQWPVVIHKEEYHLPFLEFKWKRRSSNCNSSNPAFWNQLDDHKSMPCNELIGKGLHADAI
ncbi:unnamed protein product [Fraxinus pennsylvanica]|uniref:C3H1-type domain-containing protein n=1 Tax=Fraxinus pennsylvanica TaxID=56036 RepID=A0AAD1YSW3_9LAMI|nr:unnamed protein product [Fraxinus pennsylvanica]